MYDKEFEDYFYNATCKQGDSYKDKMYYVWQAARAYKPEKEIVELQGGEYCVPIDFPDRSSGRERKTESDANKAAQAMRKRDRLAAFVYEHCGYECDYEIKGCDHYIYSDMNGEYFHVQEDEFPDLCKQYMPEETAIWLCEKLNSGEIVL